RAPASASRARGRAMGAAGTWPIFAERPAPGNCFRCRAIRADRDARASGHPAVIAARWSRTAGNAASGLRRRVHHVRELVGARDEADALARGPDVHLVIKRDDA